MAQRRNPDTGVTFGGPSGGSYKGAFKGGYGVNKQDQSGDPSWLPHVPSAILDNRALPTESQNATYSKAPAPSKVSATASSAKPPKVRSY